MKIHDQIISTGDLIVALSNASYSRLHIEKNGFEMVQHRLVDDELHARGIIEALERLKYVNYLVTFTGDDWEAVEIGVHESIEDGDGDDGEYYVVAYGKEEAIEKAQFFHAAR